MGTLLRPPGGGDPVDVPIEQVESKLAAGYSPVSVEQRAADITQQARDARANERGTLGKVAAGVTAFGAGVSAGLTDVALRKLMSKEEWDQLVLERQANPGLTNAANIVGSVAPVLLTGGAAAPASTAARVAAATPTARIAAGGTRAAEATTAALGGGTGAKIAGGVVGGAAEGALYGIGSGASELALSEDPLTMERFAATMKSHVAFGGVVGGAAGGVGKGVELGLAKARTAIKDGIAARNAAAALPEDLAKLDAKGLRKAADDELAAIEAGRVPQRKQLAEDIGAHRTDVYETSRIWQATEGSTDRELRTIAKQAANADKQLRNLLDNPKHFAENPHAAKAALQKQEHAFEQMLARRQKVLAEAADAGIPRTAAEVGEGIETTVSARALRDRGYQELPGAGTDSVRLERARKAIAEGQKEPIAISVSPAGRLDVSNGRHRLMAAIEADAPIRVRWQEGVEVLDTPEALKHVRQIGGGKASQTTVREAALQAAEVALERNRALQARIGELTSKPSSAKLAAITDAKDALVAGGGKKSLPSQLLGGTVFGQVSALAAPLGPLAPVIGAKASSFITDKVFGRMTSASGAAAKKAAAGIDAVMGVGIKVARAAPVLATSVLNGARFAPASDATPATKSKKGAEPDLASAFAARAAEIRSQVEPGLDGNLVMRHEARAAVAERLAPIAARSPLIADRLETIMARKLEFYASKLPRRPELAGMGFGPDTWRYSDMEMRTFARYVAAGEDPHAVLERVVDGTATPEDGEAIRAIYPELHADWTRQIISKLPGLKKPLPLSRRISLSLFTGVPLDPALDPKILTQLQAMYAGEVGSEGGMQAPTAQPQFGSVRSADKSTPAQQRQSQREGAAA